MVGGGDCAVFYEQHYISLRVSHNGTLLHSSLHSKICTKLCLMSPVFLSVQPPITFQCQIFFSVSTLQLKRKKRYTGKNSTLDFLHFSSFLKWINQCVRGISFSTSLLTHTPLINVHLLVYTRYTLTRSTLQAI